MPNARRITFGTQVIPTESLETEELGSRHSVFMPSPGKSLGGTGIAVVNASQWGDGWTSMMSQHQNWESFDELWNTTPASWDTDSGDVSVSDSEARLVTDSNDLAFLYIKNTGDTNEVVVALDGGTNYYIIIPAGGSTQLRGDGTQLLCNEVYVKCNSGEASTIEYLVAKG